MPELARRQMLVGTLAVTIATVTRSHAAAQSSEIRVIAANAVKDAYVTLVASFETASGHKVATTWAGTEGATRRVMAGEAYDVVIIGSRNIDQLVAAGKLTAGSRADFATSRVGVAIRAGLPRPDVSTSEAVKAAVLAAGSVAYSAGPSGAYVAELFKTMGITERIAAKVRQPSSGAEVAQILARGEVDIAFAQVSEFLEVAGLVNLGPIPASIQNITTYSAGQHVAAASPAAAALIKHLVAPDAAAAIRRMGMDPVP
ncbi:MAG: substrate-binding domain-containing protein [Rhizobiales bacterium]|nr:substrate-binding domain-containing protein [Hyphomicrobiales bacterium]